MYKLFFIFICFISICNCMEEQGEKVSFSYKFPSEITQEIIINLIPTKITEPRQLIQLIKDFTNIGMTEKYLRDIMANKTFHSYISKILENRIQSSKIIQDALTTLRKKKVTSPFVETLETVKNTLRTKEIYLNELTQAIQKDNKNTVISALEKLKTADLVINGKPLLLYAIANTVSDQIIEILLNYGANPNSSYTLEDGVEVTPLLLEVYQPNLVKLLIDHGANVNYQNNDGITPLLNILNVPQLASDLIPDQLETIKLLLENGAKINEKDPNDGSTPLLKAIKFRNQPAVDLLLLYHPDINIQDKDRYTPLMHAVINKDLPLVNKLLLYNPDITLTNNRNSTALDYATSLAKIYEEAIPIEKALRNWAQENQIAID
jgi:regulator of RNase E activity RraB